MSTAANVPLFFLAATIASAAKIKTMTPMNAPTPAKITPGALELLDSVLHVVISLTLQSLPV